jgi:hypoxanthine-guanine phosphoribosyltransferase
VEYVSARHLDWANRTARTLFCPQTSLKVELGPLDHLERRIRSRTVLLVDERIETASKLATLSERVRMFDPVRILTAVNVDISGRRAVGFEPDYAAQVIPHWYHFGQYR